MQQKTSGNEILFGRKSKWEKNEFRLKFCFHRSFIRCGSKELSFVQRSQTNSCRSTVRSIKFGRKQRKSNNKYWVVGVSSTEYRFIRIKRNCRHCLGVNLCHAKRRRAQTVKSQCSTMIFPIDWRSVNKIVFICVSCWKVKKRKEKVLKKWRRPKRFSRSLIEEETENRMKSSTNNLVCRNVNGNRWNKNPRFISIDV